MSEGNSIYGVDLSKEITPLQVRDAIVLCFSLAQEEVIQSIQKNTSIESEKIQKFFVDYLIENAFKESGGDFNNPTKETLLQVILKLKEHAERAFRDTAIIEKHLGEIKQLIDKLN